MNLTDVIGVLVEERGLDKEQVISIVIEGVKAAYSKKYPDLDFIAIYNNKTGNIDLFLEKEIVSSVVNDDQQISLRKAKVLDMNAKVGSLIKVPFEKPIGRIEILASRQFIAQKITELEQAVVYDEFKEKEGSIIAGTIHKAERFGFSVKIGETLAFLPQRNTIPGEILRVGAPLRALLKEVAFAARGDYQLFLDRASSEFVQGLLELEIPEVYEGIVEIKKIARIAGYKTKIIVASVSSEVDPVGTCVGVGGARIKPILKELGREKIDLIGWIDDLEILVKNSLKPAEIDKVEITNEGGNKKAIVWLAEDQRSFAIGVKGQNITLASRLLDVEVQLQDAASSEDKIVFDVEEKMAD